MADRCFCSLAEQLDMVAWLVSPALAVFFYPEDKPVADQSCSIQSITATVYLKKKQELNKKEEYGSMWIFS